MLIYLIRYASIFFWLLLGFVTFLLLIEQEKSITAIVHLDKIIHATVFAIVTAVGYLAYAKYPWWLYLGIITYGGLTELLQDIYTLTRHASIYDWIADIAGVLVCIILIKPLKKLLQQSYVR
jgi:VanZ family protein